MLKNVIKVLSERVVQNEIRNSSKDQESSLKGIKKEMSNLKKDIKAIRRDIQVVSEYMKSVKK